MPNEEATGKLSLDIDGLKRGLREAKQEIQRANAVFKAETAGMEDWTKDADGLSAKLKNLGQVLSQQRSILQNYNSQLKSHQDSQEKAAKEAERLRNEMEDLVKKGLSPASAEYKALDKQYQAAIKSEQAEAAQIKKLETSIIAQTGEIGKTEAAYKKWEKAQADLERESKSLVKVVSDQERELKDLKRQYVDVATAEGEDSDAARELATRIKTLSSDLGKNRTALKAAEKSADALDVSYDELGQSAKDAGRDAEEAGGAFSRAKDMFIGGLAVQVATRAWDALKQAVRGVANAMKDAVVDGAAYADDILTLASKTGLATDELQEFAYMEELIDVSTETVAKDLAKVKKQMGSAQKGSKTAAAAFEKLGVAFTEANGELRDGTEVFYDVIEALGGIDNETERDAAAMDIFGKSATDLNPLIEAGAEKLAELREEARESGNVLSGSALKSLGKAQDGMDRLSKAAEGAKKQFSIGLAPAVAEASEKMADELNSPRVQRGISVLSEGIGGLLSTITDFASAGIDLLVGALGAIDPKLKLYSDRQLELAQKAEDLKQSHEDLMTEYKDKAQVILDETRRTSDLWNELQKLVGENGEVKKADEERVDYILHELNDALGTEYSRNGDIIEQYQTMQEEIGNLIEQKKARALLDANEEAYTHAYQKQTEALQVQADLYPQVEKATRDLERAQRDYFKAKEYAEKTWTDPEDWDKALRYIDKYKVKLDDAQATFDNLSADYNTASETAAACYDEVMRYEDASAAILQGNYKKAIKLLADETGASLEYYRTKQQLNEEDKRKLSESLAAAERRVEAYKRNLKAGLSGFSESGLKELEDYVAETKALLSGAASSATGYGEEMGHNLSLGLANGISAYTGAVTKAAQGQMKAALRVMADTAQINSPSDVTEDFGEYLDLGLVKGMLRKLGLLKATAREVMSAVLPQEAMADQSATAAGARAGSGGRSVTNNFTQNIYAPKTPSRLELYRDAENLLAMAGGMS